MGPHQRTVLQRGVLGVNLDPKITPGDPTQHSGSPAVSPGYQLSRSSTSFHAGTRHKGTEIRHPKQTKSPLAQLKPEGGDEIVFQG